MAEANKDKKAETSNRQQPPPPPPVNTGTLGAKADGTPDPEVDGHADRSQVLPEQEEASKGALAKAGLAIKNLVTGQPSADETGEQTVLPPNEGILVIATRDGFYRQMRLKAGDRFNIESISEWGDWMELADEEAEKSRKEKARKARMEQQQAEAKENKADLESKAKLAGF